MQKEKGEKPTPHPPPPPPPLNYTPGGLNARILFEMCYMTRVLYKWAQIINVHCVGLQFHDMLHLIRTSHVKGETTIHCNFFAIECHVCPSLHIINMGLNASLH